MMWMALLATQAMAVDLCGDETVRTVEQALVALNEAYDTLDEGAFDRATKNLDAATSCLDEVPPPSTLARLHQAQALIGFVSGRMKATRRSLVAARLIDPGWKLSAEAFPDGHPYRELWKTATDPGGVEEIGSIAPDAWLVDGFERAEAPLERAFLLQVRREGRIVWTGYLWTFDEIPNRGQNRKVDPSETPRTLSIAASGVGRLLVTDQQADPAAGWQDQHGRAAGAGVGGVLRYTPTAFVGGELSVFGLGPADPVQGGRFGFQGGAALLLGSAVVAGRGQAHASARLGAGLDRLHAWGNGSSGTETLTWSVPAASVGLEGGWRSRDAELLLVADYLLAWGTAPYQLQTRAHGAIAVTDEVALQGFLGLQHGSLAFTGRGGEHVGRRRDLDLRLGLGIALWY